MSLDTETLLDRRRLKRHLSFWRILAILAVVAAIGAYFAIGDRGLTERRQIARITVDGMITESREQLRLLERVADANNVSGVILYVNSPGGTTTGGEALYEALRKLAAKKPLVAQFGTVAASAAYIAGLGTDHIVARGNSVTGSVGVIMQWPEFSGLLDKLGVRMNEIKSGPLKANPSPFQPMDEQGKELVQSMIAEGQQWFLGLVRERRRINTAEVPGLEQGRIFSGREAVKHNLVDEIGGEAEAVRWLEGRGVQKGLRVIDWRPGSGVDWPLGGATALVQNIFTILSGGLGTALAKDRTLGAFALDGLVSVWQPSGN